MRPYPARVPGLAHVKQIAVSADDTCALLMDGAVHCWGYNEYNQDGSLTTLLRWDPKDSRPAFTGATQVAMGATRTCAILVDGTVKCLGWWKPPSNAPYDFDDCPKYECDELVPGILHPKKLVGRNDLFCAILADTSVACWEFLREDVPQQLVALSRMPKITGVQDIALGWNFLCALTEAGEVRCIGTKGDGKIGHGWMGPAAKWTRVRGLPKVKAIAAGYWQACAIAEDGLLHCWGYDQWSLLGLGPDSDSKRYEWAVFDPDPPMVVKALEDVRHVAAGADHTCAVLGNGAVHCWGLNHRRQLGTASDLPDNSPVPVKWWKDPPKKK